MANTRIDLKRLTLHANSYRQADSIRGVCTKVVTDVLDLMCAGSGGREGTYPKKDFSEGVIL